MLRIFFSLIREKKTQKIEDDRNYKRVWLPAVNYTRFKKKNTHIHTHEHTHTENKSVGK